MSDPKILNMLQVVQEAKADELEHYGVLGMKWGVRKDRRTGKRRGAPVEGTKAAKRSAPSVSPKKALQYRKPKSKTPPTMTIRPERPAPKPASKPAPAPKPPKAEKPKTPKPKDMSVDELRSATEKARLVKEFKTHTKPPKPPKVSKIDKQISEIEKKNRLLRAEREFKQLTAKPPSFKKKLFSATGRVLAKTAERGAQRVTEHYADMFLESKLGIPMKSGKKKGDEQPAKPNPPQDKKKKKTK